MKIFAFFFLILFWLLSSGCFVKEYHNQPELVSELEEVTFSMPQTRSGDFSFKTGDSIGVFAVIRQGGTPGELLSSGNYATNRCWVFDGKTFVPKTTADRIAFPSKESLDIYCYYPYHRDNLDPTAIPVDAEKIALRAFYQGGNKGIIPLFFHQVLTEVRMVLSNPYKKQVETVFCESYTSGTLHLGSGDCSNFPSRRYATLMKEEGNNTYSCRTLPHTVKQNERLFSIRENKNLYYYKAPETEKLLPGKIRTYPVQINHKVHFNDTNAAIGRAADGYNANNVPDGGTFKFRVGRSAETDGSPIVTVGNKELRADGNYIYTLTNVTSDTTVTITGVYPYPYLTIKSDEYNIWEGSMERTNQPMFLEINKTYTYSIQKKGDRVPQLSAVPRYRIKQTHGDTPNTDLATHLNLGWNVTTSYGGNKFTVKRTFWWQKFEIEIYP